MSAPYIDVTRGRVSRSAFRAVTSIARSADRVDPREALFWAALDEHKGAIRPELVQRGKRLVLAGEYADVPKRLLRRSAQYGVDCLAQYVRDRGFDVSTSDVLEFFAQNPTRPKPARTEADLARTLREMGARVTKDDAAVLMLQAEMGALCLATETPEQMRAKKARRRAKARDLGLCIACAVRSAREGRVTCQECSDAAAERVKARRAAARRGGG